MTTVVIRGVYLNDRSFTTEETRPLLIKSAARLRWRQYWEEHPPEQKDLKRSGIERPNDLQKRLPILTAIQEIQWNAGPISQMTESIATPLAVGGRLFGKGKVATSMFAGLGLTRRQQTEPKTTRPSEESSSSPKGGA